MFAALADDVCDVDLLPEAFLPAQVSRRTANRWSVLLSGGRLLGKPGCEAEGGAGGQAT